MSKNKECEDEGYLQTGKRDVKALVRLWCQKEIPFFVETLEVYAKKLIDVYLKSVGDGFRLTDEREMLAEVFRPDVEGQILEVPKRLTQLELCDRFWKKKCSEYHASLRLTGISKDAKVLEEEALEFFEKVALKSLYPKDSLWQDDLKLQHCHFVGMELTMKNGQSFIYPSLADYFAALYFIKTVQQVNRPDGFENFLFTRVLDGDENVVAEFMGSLMLQMSVELNIQVTEKHVQRCVKYLHNLDDAATEENSEQLGILILIYRSIKKFVEQYPVEERRNHVKKYFDDWLVGHYIKSAADSENVPALETLLNIGIAEDMKLEGVIKHLFQNDDTCSLIVKPAFQKVTEQMLDYLMKKGVDVTLLLRPTRNTSFLGEAVEKRNAKLVDWILNFAVENRLNSKIILDFDDICQSPLHIAAQLGCVEIFHKILTYVTEQAENKKSLLLPNEAGRGLLHQAAMGKEETLVRTIIHFSIANEVDPTSLFNPDKTGRSAIHQAVSLAKSKNNSQGRSKCESFVDEMLAVAYEKNINLVHVLGQDQWMMTPVHLAARSGLAKAIQIIFEHAKKSGIDGSKFLGRNKKGKTPFHLAAEEGHTEVIEMLIDLIHENGINAVKVMKTDGDEETPLSYAVNGGHKTMAELLLDFGLKQKVSQKTLLSGFGQDVESQVRKRLSKCTEANEMAKILFSRIKPSQQEEESEEEC